MYVYELQIAASYIPVHLNAIFSSKYMSFSYDLIDESLAGRMLEHIKLSSSTFFILDLTRIKTAHSRVFEDFSKLSLGNKHVIFINADDTLLGHLSQTIPDTICEDTTVFLTEEGRDHFYKEEGSSKTSIDKLINGIIANYLLETSTSKDVFLDSSNVYSNMYVDIKQLFYEPNIYLLAIYLLCKKIADQFHREHYDGFICASNNGSVLATSLSLLLNKPCVHLMNLGPHLTIMDREIIDKIAEKKTYLFIYDFICLGTELKLVKTLATLRGAKVAASFGIANHLLPSRQEPPRRYEPFVFSLFTINEDFNFNYQVSIA